MENQVPKTIIAAAYKAYNAGEAGPGDRIAILIDYQHQEIHDLPKRVAEAVVAALPNGNGNGRKKRLKERVKEAGPAFTRGGLGLLVAERLFQLLT